MATKKISELEAITEADDSDVLAIVDVSEGKTKKITKNNLLIGAGHSIEMSLNQETYALTLTLKNAAGTELSTASIDLPNENSITDISYNNGKLTLTKQSGTTTEVDITGLINGLVTESDFETFTTQLNQVLQELDETKADAEDVEALQTRVTELEQENEDLKKNQLTYTPEISTSHYLQDSADSRFRRFIPIARTTQESTSGKQLFNKLIKTPKSNGAKYSTDSLSVEVDFTNSSDEYFSILMIESPTTKTYTLAFEASGVKNGENPRYSLWDGGSNFILKNGRNVVVIPNGTEIKNNKILLDDQSKSIYPNTSKVTFTNFMLVEGEYTEETMPVYEPYTGGEPAPNSNYPKAIKNTGDNVNEFDISQIPSGSVITNNGDGTLTLANNSNNNGYISTQIKFKDLCPNVKVGDTIVLNFKTTSQMENKNRIYISTVNIPIYKNTPIVVTQDMLDNYVAFYGGYNETAIISEIKLEKNSVPTPYSPYGCGNINEKIQNANFWEDSKRLKLSKLSYEDGTYSANDGDTRSPIQYKIQQYDIDDKYIANTQVSKTINSVGRYSLTSTKVENAIYVKIANNGSSSEFRVLYDLSNIDVGEKFTVILDIIDKTVGASKFKNVMLVKGEYTENNLPDYIPHSEQTLSFPLAQGQKLYEGSHPDDDEKVHHKWGEMVLPAINSLTSGTVFGVSCKFGAINIPTMQSQSSVSGNFFCDKVKYANGVWGKYQGYVIAKNFIVLTDLEDTVENFNSKISGATLQFPLAEEQTEDFTEEQKTAWEQIKKARTYKNVTHISSEDETPANVEIEYVRDLETVINNLTTRVETIESEV